MSKKMRSDRKPPLANAKSPLRLNRPRRVLRSESAVLQTPQASRAKSICSWDAEESDLRPEYYNSISSELGALAEMVQSEVGSARCDSGCLLERGRLYDEYSARRNERLRRKMGVEEAKKTVCGLGLGVNVESSKSKKLRTPTPTPRRYALRSMSKDKENKKPPLPLNLSSNKSLLATDRKTRLRNI